ncbi:hypothetical protein PR048_016967 [Dryococelus australis]|uniref:Uncharacterized protein n=1 Tax=Dryococelus australis TaxID=614101 RepID=A0ABQ9H895_9NEOP|nr:hypothetical protein PR048_016967 [Dryococelus australis]
MNFLESSFPSATQHARKVLDQDAYHYKYHRSRGECRRLVSAVVRSAGPTSNESALVLRRARCSTSTRVRLCRGALGPLQNIPDSCFMLLFCNFKHCNFQGAVRWCSSRDYSPPIRANQVQFRTCLLGCGHQDVVTRTWSPGRDHQDIRMWETRRTMPLVGEFLPGDLPFPSPFHSGAAPYSPLFTVIGSKNLDVKSRPDLFTHSLAVGSAGAGEAEDPREDPPTNGIVWHDSHMRRSAGTRPGIEPGSSWWEASRLTVQPLWPLLITYANATLRHYSPPSQANRVRFPGGYAPGFSHVGIVPDYVAGRRVFYGTSHFPRLCIPALLHTHLTSPSSALKTSISPCGFLLASHQGEPGSIPGRVTGYSHVGIVPDDAVGRRVFSGISCFPHPFFPAPLHTHLYQLPAHKTSLLRAAQISSHTHSTVHRWLALWRLQCWLKAEEGNLTLGLTWPGSRRYIHLPAPRFTPPPPQCSPSH